MHIVKKRKKNLNPGFSSFQKINPNWQHYPYLLKFQDLRQIDLNGYYLWTRTRDWSSWTTLIFSSFVIDRWYSSKNFNMNVSANAYFLMNANVNTTVNANAEEPWFTNTVSKHRHNEILSWILIIIFQQDWKILLSQQKYRKWKA